MLLATGKSAPYDSCSGCNVLKHRGNEVSLLVARQPVLDTSLNTWAYELLFRSGLENAFQLSGSSLEDGDQATLSVMDNAFFNGIGHMTAGHKALINFTQPLLLDGYAEILPQDKVIIEILESVEPDVRCVNACYNLKNLGYTIALDDFQYTPAFDDLLGIADIVKVDFRLSDAAERMDLAERLLPLGIELLAEKVETHEEFVEAKELGYKYFQGYFFSKPQIVEQRQIAESKTAKLHLLREVNRPQMDVGAIEAVFKSDPGLTLRLLRYLNSAYFGFDQKIKGIRHAVTLLGRNNLRKWATVMMMSESSEDKPPELFKLALCRARFCELLAESLGKRKQQDEFFLAGLLSLVEAILDAPKELAFSEMALSDELRNVLLGEEHQSALSQAVVLAEGFERGTWGVVDGMAFQLDIVPDVLKEIKDQAVIWTDELTERLL